MRAVLQRVSEASVTVEGRTVGAIGPGLLVLAGVHRGDTVEDARWIASKITALRIFPDEAGRMNRSLAESGGGVLLVPQFTLYGDARKGRRPSFERAARPETAVPLLEEARRAVEAAGVPVATGVFGAHMEVALRNDGPVTILLDSEDRRRDGGRGAGPAPGPSALSILLDAGARAGGVPIVLASASPRRRALLEELGLEFTVDPVPVDEASDLPADFEERARALAERKARAAAARRSEGVVIAADTIVVLGRRAFGKPASEKEAVRMLVELSGREHRVLTGVCVGEVGAGRFRSAVVSTRVRFHALGKEEIRRYVATGEPLDKAGAYAIQGRGALLVAGIEGDYTNVVGLPLGTAIELLGEALAGAAAAERGTG